LKTYPELNTDYQTRVKFLSKQEQIAWHEANKLPPEPVQIEMETGEV